MWDSRIALTYTFFYLILLALMLFGDHAAIMFGTMTSVYAMPLIGLIYALSLRFSFSGMAIFLFSLWTLPDLISLCSPLSNPAYFWFVSWSVLPIFYGAVLFFNKPLRRWNATHFLLSFSQVSLFLFPDFEWGRFLHAIPLVILSTDLFLNNYKNDSLKSEKRFKMLHAVSLLVILITEMAYTWLNG
ncbi:MAG: hypothetical protein ACK4K0_12525 [Flavobacteriales bacterium]